MPQSSLDTAVQNMYQKKTKKSIYKSKIKILIKFLYHIIVIPHLLLAI